VTRSEQPIDVRKDGAETRLSPNIWNTRASVVRETRLQDKNVYGQLVVSLPTSFYKVVEPSARTRRQPQGLQEGEARPKPRARACSEATTAVLHNPRLALAPVSARDGHGVDMGGRAAVPQRGALASLWPQGGWMCGRVSPCRPGVGLEQVGDVASGKTAEGQDGRVGSQITGKEGVGNVQRGVN